MRIKYSPDADVLTIRLREGKPADSRDIAEGVIVHLSTKGQPLKIGACLKVGGTHDAHTVSSEVIRTES